MQKLSFENLKNYPMIDVKILRGDITKSSADAIVNAAKPSLKGGGGVDGAIHKAGGPEIYSQCMDIVSKRGRLNTGEAVATSAGNLKAKLVIHTVGPRWFLFKFSEEDEKQKEKQLIECYRSSLEILAEKELKSIAFPCISTGVYRYPKEKAAQIAYNYIASQKIAQNIEVEIWCYDDENLMIYERLSSKIN